MNNLTKHIFEFYCMYLLQIISLGILILKMLNT